MTRDAVISVAPANSGLRRQLEEQRKREREEREGHIVRVPRGRMGVRGLARRERSHVVRVPGSRLRVVADTLILMKGPGQGNRPALSSQVADADFAYRAGGTGVVWWHNFVSSDEVDAFRWSSGIGNDPDSGGTYSDWCRHITSDYVSGGGCLELYRAAGSNEGAAWWRPFSPMDTGSGKAVDDPAANGDLTVRTWEPTQGGSQTAGWAYGDYGPDSTGTWEGDQFFIQVQLNVDQRRLDEGSAAGKIQYITRTEQSLTAQEINTYYKSNTKFGLYRQGSPEIINELPPVDFEAGWATYLYQIVPGDEVEGGSDTGGNTIVNVWRQDWVGGDVEYTKIFQKSDLGIDYQNAYDKAWNALLLTSYSNDVTFSSEFYNRFDEVIFSRRWIPPKSTFSSSALQAAADALSAGEYSTNPITKNPNAYGYDISWQNHSGFWDDMRREMQYMGKAQNGGTARHYIYSEETDSWRYTNLDVAPSKLGHIWGVTFTPSGEDVGDYYYIEQDGQDIDTIRYMDRSVEAGQGTTNSPWTTLPEATAFTLIYSGTQVYPVYHPNLMGPGLPGIYVGASYRNAYFDIGNQSWSEVNTTQNLGRAPGIYLPGKDVAIIGAYTSTACIVIRAGEYGDTTPDTYSTPIDIVTGTGNHGKLIVDPRDDSVAMLLESKGDSVWTSSDGGATWNLESFTHPFWDIGVTSLGYGSSNDGGSWSPCSIGRYGCVLSTYSTGSNAYNSIMWRPG